MSVNIKSIAGIALLGFMAACNNSPSVKTKGLSPMAKMHVVFDDYLKNTGIEVKIIELGRASGGQLRIAVFDNEFKRKWLYYDGQDCGTYNDIYVEPTKTKGLCKFDFDVQFPR